MSTTHDTCTDVEIISGYLYYEPAVLIPIFIMLHLLLLSHTIYHEVKGRRNGSFENISIRARVFYIMIQIIGIYWLFDDLFRLVIDPYVPVLKNNYLCDIAGYSPKIIPGPFYGVYLYQILFRLDQAFTDSFLAMNKITIYLFQLCIIPIAIGPMVFLSVYDHPHVCIQSWEPLDVSATLKYCKLPITALTSYCIIAALIFITILNIIFGAIFTVKLHSLLSGNHENEKIKFKFKALIVKNCILTLTGSVTSVTMYALYIMFDVGAFLYFDIFINCLVIGLMFAYNDDYYKRCCKCFVLLCFLECDKNKDALNKAETLRYVNSLHGLQTELGLAEMQTVPSNTHTISNARSTATLTIIKPSADITMDLEKIIDGITPKLTSTPDSIDIITSCSTDAVQNAADTTVYQESG